MATYVPGYQRYERETTPFTPDYKFLSSVLDTRQDRFDTNYKQLSDQYSKIVYADMSRDDTIDARNQYTEQLIPKIEKLSGMDLSIRQNVDAAETLFKPFYEDDLIIKDLVFTSQYKRNMQLAGTLKESANADERKKYWSTGIQAMNYQMQDFKMDSRDDALKAALPTYVENVDLEAMSMKILKDAGFEDVEMDLPVKKGDPFIIRQKNGSLQVPGAYNFLMKTLLEDPNVIDAYRTSGFVSARNHAELGVQNGLYKTVGEGKNAWAQSTLNDLRDRNEKANPILKNQFEKALEAKQNWERYEKEEGIIPGSDEQKAMDDAFANYEQSEGALKRNEDDLQRMGEADENTDSLNFAYNMLMNYNLSSDILAAATSYSKRDYSQTIAMVNPYTKMEIQHKYDIARDNNASSNRRAEAVLKGQIEGNVNKKGEIINPAFLAASIFDGPTDPDAFSTKAEDVETVKDPISRNNQDERLRKAAVDVDKAAFITDLTNLKQSELPVADQTGNMTVSINGKDVTGDAKKIRTLLTLPENKSDLERIYKEKYKELTDFNKTNPASLTNPRYNALVNSSDAIQGKMDQIIHFSNVKRETYKENFKNALNVSSIGIGKDFKNGVPLIVEEDGGLMSKEEFREIYLSKSKNRKLRGDAHDHFVGRGRRNDKGEFTYTAATMFPSAADFIDETLDEYIWNDMVHNESKAIEAANKSYNKQYKALNSTLNETFTVSGLDPQGDLFQPLSADAFYRGVDLDDMNASNLYTYGGDLNTFSVSAIASNPQVYDALKDLVTQYNSSEPNIITGRDGMVDPLANQIVGESLKDIRGYLLDPKSAESKKFSMGIELRPVSNITDDGVARSSIVLSYTDQYLKNFKSDAVKSGQTKATALTNNQVNNFGEITMSFPTATSVIDVATDRYNFSSTDTKINMSDDNSYLYDMYKENAGSFRVFKEQGMYYYSMDLLGVDAKTGLFVKIGQESMQPILNENNQPARINEIDRIVSNYRATFEQRSKDNLKKQKSIKPSVTTTN